MPCMCWYDPPEASKRLIKGHCVAIVDEIKRLSMDGDPHGCELQDVQELLAHLYTGKCAENNEKQETTHEGIQIRGSFHCICPNDSCDRQVGVKGTHTSSQRRQGIQTMVLPKM